MTGEKAPPYQLLPALSTDEYAALKADIAERGVLVPVEMDEQGNVLDGHHRVRAWQELRDAGVRVPPYESLHRVGLSEEQKRNHVRALNLFRRHLSEEALRDHMRAMRRDRATLEVIARATGRSIETVRRALKESPEFSFENSGLTITNRRGQQRPAHQRPRQPRTVRATNAAERERVTALATEVLEVLPEKPVTARRAERLAREQAALQVQPGASAPNQSGDSYRLIRADFRQADIAPGTVDALITDPPYARDGLPLISELGAFAAQVLRPGGSLLLMIGQSYLPEIFRRLAPYLVYRWTLAYLTPGGQSPQIWPCKVNTFWKPVLWYTRGDGPPDEWRGDVLRSAVNDNDKRFHEWGQSESGMADLVERFTRPGQTILDPFMGGGTTGAIAVRLRRRFIGVELDPEAFEIAGRRLAGEATGVRI